MSQFAQGFRFRCPSCGSNFFQAQNIWTEADLVDSFRRRVGIVESLNRALKGKPQSKTIEKQHGDKYEQALLDYLKYRHPQRYTRLPRERRNVVSIVREIGASDRADEVLYRWNYYSGEVFTKYCEQCEKDLREKRVKKRGEDFPDLGEPQRMPMIKATDMDHLLTEGWGWKRTARLEWMSCGDDDPQDDRGRWKGPTERDESSRLTTSKAPPSVESTSAVSSVSRLSSLSRHSESLGPSISDLDDEYHDRPLYRGLGDATRNAIFPRDLPTARESLRVTAARHPRYESSEQRSETTYASRHSDVATDSSALSSRTDRTTTTGASQASSGRTSTATDRHTDDSRSRVTSASYTTASGETGTPRHPRRSSTWSATSSASVVSPQHHHSTRSGIPSRANTYREPPPLPTSRQSKAAGRGNSAARQDERHVQYAAPGSSEEESRPNYRQYHNQPWLPYDQRPLTKLRELNEIRRPTSPYPARSRQLEEWADYDDEESEVAARRGSMVPGMDPRPSRSRSRSRGEERERSRSRSSSSADFEPRHERRRGKESDRDEGGRRR